MSNKITLKNLDQLSANESAALQVINENYRRIDEAINMAVFRNGEIPSYMLKELDMNSYKIINLAAPVNDRDAVRLEDLKEFINQYNALITKINALIPQAKLTLMLFIEEEIIPRLDLYVAETAGNAVEAAEKAQQAAIAAEESAQSAQEAADNAGNVNEGVQLAKDWAIKMDGKVVENGTPIDYSSKYWSVQSQNSANTSYNYSVSSSQSAASAASSVAGFQTIVDNASSSITTQTNQSLTQITNAGTAQVTNVNQAGTINVNNVNTAGTTQVTNITNQGNTQYNRVIAAGDTAQEAADKSQEIYDTLTGLDSSQWTIQDQGENLQVKLDPGKSMYIINANGRTSLTIDMDLSDVDRTKCLMWNFRIDNNGTNCTINVRQSGTNGSWLNGQSQNLGASGRQSLLACILFPTHNAIRMNYQGYL